MEKFVTFNMFSNRFSLIVLGVYICQPIQYMIIMFFIICFINSQVSFKPELPNREKILNS